MAVSGSLPMSVDMRIANAYAVRKPFEERQKVLGTISVPANDLVVRYVRDAVEEGKPIETILDVGCGLGYFLARVAPYVKKAAYGVDSSASMVERAREVNKNNPNVDIRVGNASQLEFEAGSISVVGGNLVHYYLPLPLALEEQERVLAPGGLFYALTLAPDVMSTWARLKKKLGPACDVTPSRDIERFSVENAYAQVRNVFHDANVVQCPIVREIHFPTIDEYWLFARSCLGLFQDHDGSALTPEKYREVRREAARILLDEKEEVFETNASGEAVLKDVLRAELILAIKNA